MLSIVVPPDPLPIDPLGAGSYSAPAMWDACLVCGEAWTVVWDPWQPEGHGHAVWIEA